MIESLTEYWNSLKLWEILFIGLFLLLFLIRLVSDLVFYGKVAFFKPKKKGTADPFSAVSLIFTVRNEEANVRENLPAVLSYMTGRGEVVVVDDFSQDQTYTVLGLIREQFPNLKFSSLNQEIRYSVKVSQNIGMKAATNEWVVFLPPQVSVLPENWLFLIQNSFLTDKNAVLGYMNISPGKGFYNHLYRMESFFQQLKSYASLLNGFGFVVNEENIAFRKSEYFNQGGYGMKINEAYANLELIINNFIKKKTSVLLLETDSSLRIQAAKNKKDYLDLLNKYKRIRSNLPSYKKAALATDALLRIFWLAVTVGAFAWFGPLRIFIAVFFLLRVIERAVILKLCQSRLKEKRIFLTSVIYDCLMPYLLLFVNGSTYKAGKKYGWKK